MKLLKKLFPLLLVLLAISYGMISSYKKKMDKMSDTYIFKKNK